MVLKLKRHGAPLLLMMILLVSCSQSVTGGSEEKPPDPPKHLKAGIVDKGIQLSWDCVPGASHYTVFWGRDREDYRNLVNSKECSAILVGLKRNEFYAFAITAWNQRGESDYSKGAEIIYDDDPAHAEYYLAEGNEQLKKGQYKNALTYFSTAIRLAPDSAHAYQSRAQLYEQTHRTELAKHDYQMAEKLLKRKPLSRKQ